MPKTKFIIYKYSFLKEENLFTKKNETKEEAINKALETFSSLFESKSLDVYHSKKDGTPCKYSNQIERTLDGVTYLRICDHIERTRVKDFKETLEDTEPFCAVVVDTRAGYEQIAIERKSDVFRGETDKIRNLLQDAFNRVLIKYGFKIAIKRKIKVTDFWHTVHEQVHKKQDTIRKIIIDFPDPDKNINLDTSPGMLDSLKLYSSIAKLTNANDCQILLSTTKDKTLTLQRAENDVTHIVDLCCRYGYNISVYFRQMGVYRSKEKMNACYWMEDDILTDFVNKKLVNYGEGDTFELVRWLTDIKNITEGFEDEKPRAKRRKRSA